MPSRPIVLALVALLCVAGGALLVSGEGPAQAKINALKSLIEASTEQGQGAAFPGGVLMPPSGGGGSGFGGHGGQGGAGSSKSSGGSGKPLPQVKVYADRFCLPCEALLNKVTIVAPGTPSARLVLSPKQIAEFSDLKVDLKERETYQKMTEAILLHETALVQYYTSNNCGATPATAASPACKSAVVCNQMPLFVENASLAPENERRATACGDFAASQYLATPAMKDQILEKLPVTFPIAARDVTPSEWCATCHHVASKFFGAKSWMNVDLYFMGNSLFTDLCYGEGAFPCFTLRETMKANTKLLQATFKQGCTVGGAQAIACPSTAFCAQLVHPTTKAPFCPADPTVPVVLPTV